MAKSMNNTKRFFPMLLVGSCLLKISASPCFAQEVFNKEIAVSADAWSWSSPDHSRITFALEESGKTTDEAFKKLNEKGTRLVKELQALAEKDFKAVERGTAVLSPKSTPATAGAGSANTNQGFQVRRYIAIETTVLANVGILIDKALTLGAVTLSDVDYAVTDNSQAKLKAMEDASHAAKEKAATIAKSLGVSLGPLLSAAVTEEPVGKILRERRERGESPAIYSDSESHVFVTLRYEVGSGVTGN